MFLVEHDSILDVSVNKGYSKKPYFMVHVGEDQEINKDVLDLIEEHLHDWYRHIASLYKPDEWRDEPI